jgi:hypothetical protein
VWGMMRDYLFALLSLRAFAGPHSLRCGYAHTRKGIAVEDRYAAEAVIDQ